MKTILPVVDISGSLSSKHTIVTLSFASSFPEHGDFLALDLGGSNFRVMLVQVQRGRRRVNLHNQVYPLPQDVILGVGEHVRLQWVVRIKLTELSTRQGELGQL